MLQKCCFTVKCPKVMFIYVLKPSCFTVSISHRTDQDDMLQFVIIFTVFFFKVVGSAWIQTERDMTFPAFLHAS